MAHRELNLRERRAIEDMLNAKIAVREIAAEIDRHVSTVYREIKRNHYDDKELPELNGYYGMVAQRAASQRRTFHQPRLRRKCYSELIQIDGSDHRWLEFRWKGVSLPYSVFDKDQRVTHAAITENKRLGAVLEFIKEEQEKTPSKKRRAGKQRSIYKPTGRRNDGWNSLAARRAKEARKASQGCDI
jgi:Helix-turn-helix domain